MNDSTHAEFGPSSSERRLNCKGSLGLEREAPKKESSFYADRGNFVHDIGEEILKHWARNGRGELDRDNVESFRPVEAPVAIDPWDDPGETACPGTKEPDALDQALMHVEHCIDVVYTFDDPFAVSVNIERRLTLLDEPPMFGTVDFFATGLRGGIPTMALRDLKSGTTPVYAKDSPQLAYYACMVRKHSVWPLVVFDLGIVQPRRKTKKKILEMVYSGPEMDAWEHKLIEGAKESHRQAALPEEERDYNPGKWCFFCRAREACKAKRRQDDERRKAKEALAIVSASVIGIGEWILVEGYEQEGVCRERWRVPK